MSQRNPVTGALMATCAFTIGLLVAVAGCQGVYEATVGGGGGGGGGGGELENCAPEKIVCVGGPDETRVCTCNEEVWDPCTKYPGKCAKMPVPSGGTDWDCDWSEFIYTCKKKGKTPAPGGSGWTCRWDEASGQWICDKDDVPVPGKGAWSCRVDKQTGQLVCTPKTGGDSQWSCATDATGRTVCKKSGDLPPGGNNDWKCHQSGTGWVCVGSAKTPPGGGVWQCTKLKSEFGQDIYRCTKSGNDLPPGGGSWSCVMGSEFGGKKCEKTPTPTTPPKVGGKCKVGDKAWCDGHTYCGWGQVVCDPATGTWKTKVIKGKTVLYCYEVNDLVPNTVCACYHFFYNSACCERKDCIIPAGTNGQKCPTSKGKLCDYCNPFKSECSEPGGKCVVTNNNETYCGRSCSVVKPCPAGYGCMNLKLKVGTIKQCVPNDYSCYF
jgi:hypothetical protein